MKQAMRRIAAAWTLILVAVATCASLAGAETLTFEPGGSIAFTGRLIWTEAFGLRGTCNMTIAGTLERRVNTAAGSSMGTISSVTTESCSPWRVMTLRPAAWALTRILGQPETITGILTLLRTFGALIENGASNCLYFIEYGILIGVDARRMTAEVTVLEVQARLSRTLSGTCLLGTLGGTLTFEPRQRVGII